MTTILGVKTVGTELEGIVLASDTQLSTSDEGKLTEKRTGYKLITGGFWAMGYAGTTSTELLKFLGFIRGQKKYGSSDEMVDEIITKSIEKKHFEKIMLLNKENRLNDEPLDDLNTFILAVNRPELELYQIDEFGNIRVCDEEDLIWYISIGDGDKVKEYAKALVYDGKVDPGNFGIDSAIRFAFGAMHKAQESITTGGPPDIAVITKDSVKLYGKYIRDMLSDAEKRAMNDIISKYMPPKESETPKQS